MKLKLVLLSLVLCLSFSAFSQNVDKMTIPRKGIEVLAIQNLSGFLQELVNWVQKKPQGSGDYYIGFTVASNQRSELVTYTVGALRYKTVSGKGVFSGQGTRYFSDRQWRYPAQPGQISIDQYPFDPSRTDKVTVDLDATTGQINIKEGAKQTLIKSEYGHGVLYGFGGGTMFVFSFNKGFIGTIK